MLYHKHVRDMIGGTTKVKMVEGIPPLILPKSKGKALKDYKVYGNSYQRVPQEYQEVEYIESTGTQWINTKVLATIDSGLKAYVDVISNGETDTKTLIGANGSAVAGNWFGAAATWTSGSGAVSNVDSATRIQTTITFGQAVEYELEGIHYSRNCSQFGAAGYDGTTLFHTRTSTVNYYFKGKLYSCKLWNNNKLVRDFIPCYNKTTNVIGLYDLVEDKFYTNAGTGTFLKGADVKPTPDKPIEIESVGVRTINILNINAKNTENGYVAKSYIGSTGNIVSNNAYDVSEYMEVESSSNYIYSINGVPYSSNPGHSAPRVCFYDKDKTFISATGTAGLGIFEFVTPSNCKYIRVPIYLRYTTQMITKGTDAQTVFEPYGKYKIPIEVKTKNLFSKEKYEFTPGYNLDATTGLPVSFGGNQRGATLKPIDVSKYDYVTFSLKALDGYTGMIYSTFNGDTFITRTAVVTDELTIDVRNATKLYLCWYSSSGAYNVNNIATDAQLEEGNVKTSYVPFLDIVNIYLTEPLRRKKLKDLPNEYKALEYIESTGTQWIDTGVSIKNINYLKAHLFFTGRKGDYAYGGNSNNDSFACWGTYRNTRFTVKSSTTATFEIIPDDAIIEITESKIKLNDDEQSISMGTSSLNDTLKLFAGKDATYKSQLRCYYFILGSANGTVRDFIPCYRKSDNEIGMYDLVNGVFYTNQGTGTFIKGPEIDCDILDYKNQKIYRYVNVLDETGQKTIDESYELRKTPVEESITLPQILTAKGDNTLDVNTKIKPSNMLVKYIMR